MKVLGITPTYHDVSACVMEGGNITAFVEEERLTRVKHGGGSVHHPLQSIKEVLNIADLKLSDLDRIATSRNPDRRKHTRIEIAK
jgi:carbamoyltransferase